MSGSDDDELPYVVGYGKPPKATRFRKGQSGNPRGRPKGARGLRSLLEQALAQEITVSEGGRTTRISKRKALILSLITKALKGDMRAAAQMLLLMEVHDEKPQRTEGLTINVVEQFDDPE